MQLPIELNCIADHESDVAFKSEPIFVLIAFGFVFHVLQGDGLLDQIAVVRSVLPSWLVVEQVRFLTLHHFFDNLHEDSVEALRAVLLLASATFVRRQRLILEVVIAEAMRLKLRSR